MDKNKDLHIQGLKIYVPCVLYSKEIGSWKTRKSTKEATMWKRKDLRNMEAKSPRQKGGFQDGSKEMFPFGFCVTDPVSLQGGT